MRTRISALVARGQRRAADLGRPEVLVGIAIVASWAALALGPLVPTPVTIVAMLALVGLHVAAVETGNFTLLWATTGTVLTLIAVAARTSLSDLDPVVLTAAGLTALAHNEAGRLGYVRRRGAAVERAILAGSVAAIGLVGLVSLVAVGIAGPLADGPADRSWLWMPLAITVVLALLVGFTVGPTWRAPKATKERWQPGDRLPPHRDQR